MEVKSTEQKMTHIKAHYSVAHRSLTTLGNQHLYLVLECSHHSEGKRLLHQQSLPSCVPQALTSATNLPCVCINSSIVDISYEGNKTTCAVSGFCCLV